MRATRAFVGAFGAGISLAIASSLMLLVVSSVIAFNGWPDDLNGAPDPEVAALSQGSDERGRAIAASNAGVVALPPAAPRTAPTRDDRSTGSSGATAGVQDQTSSSAGSTQPVDPGTAADVRENASPGSSGSGPSAKADPVGQAGHIIRDTTGAVADVVEPVAPSVSGALQSVGAAGADATDQVGGAVDHTVGTVLQP